MSYFIIYNFVAGFQLLMKVFQVQPGTRESCTKLLQVLSIHYTVHCVELCGCENLLSDISLFNLLKT